MKMSSDAVRNAAGGMPVTEADVEGFAAKLEAWCQALPPGEQAVLQQLVACAEAAAPEELDVEAYASSGIGARVARICAASLMGVALAGSLGASADPGANASGAAKSAAGPGASGRGKNVTRG